MTKRIWKMCVVALMIASPAVCSAVSIAEAVAAAGDGTYVKMDPGSSITLSFGTDCSGTDPAVIVKLAQDSTGIRVEFYYEGDPLYYNNGEYDIVNFETGDTVYGPGQADPFDELGVYWEAVPFDSVTITAYGSTAVHLDAVQDGGTSAFGTYAGHTGTVKPLPAPAPEITGISIEPTALDSETSVTATFTDADGGEHTATIDWGDGSPVAAGAVDEDDGTVSGVHTYAATGVCTVTITVTDDDLGTGSDTAYAPVYDPDAWSWVTGAGWYPEEGGPCGKAFFGFVCRQRAGHTPLGEMRLRWGQNRFEATSYEWLVVTADENTAWFAGTGTINGQGSYDFLVEVADAENEIWIVIGDQYDNNGPLSIEGGRIKIRCWN